MHSAYILFGMLLVTLGLFIWGRWRHDVVAAMALLILVLIGIVPAHNAFAGFSNPAVITVACVMIITHTLTQSGVITTLVQRISPMATNMTLHVGILSLITALLSAFMNNVGALALMMPVAIQSAVKHKRSPSFILMPLAFASVLGGLTTAIGTPPNLLISAFREQATGHAFAMFDFAPVGLTIAAVTLLFLTLVGWRLIPKERKAPADIGELFQMQDYISEIIVPNTSSFIDRTFVDIENSVDCDVTIIGLIRGKRKRLAIPQDEHLLAKDVLIVQAAHDELQKFLDAGGLEVVGGETISPDRLSGEDINIVEAIVPQGSRLEHRSWQGMRLRSRYRINLIAIARQGKAFKNRLNHVNFRAGDVVLLQGDASTIHEKVLNLGLLPLVERGVQVGLRRKAFFPIAIFVTAITLTALQIISVPIAFSLVVLLYVVFNIMPIRKIYDHIDWSIIVLLAALIPIGHAMQTTGGTTIIADFFIYITHASSPIVLFGLLLIITMTLSDIMNNAATAIIMAPIAVTIAQTLQVSVDPFLMTVAVGASCSFLTPISHQNNTLVMGPGGYKFFDYTRVGLPIEGLVLLVGLPAILWFWPI